MSVSTYLSIITLNVNGLNAPIKRHRIIDCIKKEKNLQHNAYKRLTSGWNTHRLKVKEWKNIFHANRNDKKAGVAILISGEIDFKIKIVTRDKEGHYIMIKGSIQEDITIINVYLPNIGAYTSVYKATVNRYKRRNWQ